MCEEGLFTKKQTGGGKVRGQLWNKPSPRGVGYLVRDLKYSIIEFLTDNDMSHKTSMFECIYPHS